MLNGSKLTVEIVKETPEFLFVKSQGVEMRLPLKRIHAISEGGSRRVINEMEVAKAPAKPAEGTAAPAAPALPKKPVGAMQGIAA